MSTPRPRPIVVISGRNGTTSPVSSMRMNGPSTAVPPQVARRNYSYSSGLPKRGDGESPLPEGESAREIGLDLSERFSLLTGRLRAQISGGNTHGGQTHQRSRRCRSRVHSAQRHRRQGRSPLLSWLRHPRSGRPHDLRRDRTPAAVRQAPHRASNWPPTATELVRGRELGTLAEANIPEIAEKQAPMEALRTLVSLAGARRSGQGLQQPRSQPAQGRPADRAAADPRRPLPRGQDRHHDPRPRPRAEHRGELPPPDHRPYPRCSARSRSSTPAWFSTPTTR